MVHWNTYHNKTEKELKAAIAGKKRRIENMQKSAPIYHAKDIENEQRLIKLMLDELVSRSLTAKMFTEEDFQ